MLYAYIVIVLVAVSGIAFILFVRCIVLFCLLWVAGLIWCKLVLLLLWLALFKLMELLNCLCY